MPNSAISNFGRRVADGFLAGHGTDHPVQRGIVSGLGILGSFLGGPLAGQGVRRLGGMLLDKRYGTGNYASPSVIQRQMIDGPQQGAADVNFGITPMGPMHVNGYMSGPGQFGSVRDANPQSFLTGHVNDVNWTPTANHNLSFRGSNGQMIGPNTQLGGFSGSNPLAFGIGRGGAGSITGEAAQDWMQGAHQSIFANRQQGTDARGFRNVF